jgi:hypothetical protein
MGLLSPQHIRYFASDWVSNVASNFDNNNQSEKHSANSEQEEEERQKKQWKKALKQPKPEMLNSPINLKIGKMISLGHYAMSFNRLYITVPTTAPTEPIRIGDKIEVI